MLTHLWRATNALARTTMGRNEDGQVFGEIGIWKGIKAIHNRVSSSLICPGQHHLPRAIVRAQMCAFSARGRLLVSLPRPM
jgi:hypothetical protein